MRLGVLFSGGKDSCFALYKASKEHEIVCLMSMRSKNPDSYMFHTPNTDYITLQAESMGIPLLWGTTKGEKEIELEDLISLIKSAVKKYRIEGIVTGAIASVYQASRIQKICDNLNIKCVNPLWQKDQIGLLKELLENKFEVVITKVAAFSLDESFLGKKLDNDIIKKLYDLQSKYKINPAGEGGELETFVTYAPMFRKRIIIKKSKTDYADNLGFFIIEKAVLE
ncbi:MAG: diphthine--ammonia ligase [Candidatus Woesearchaeota archaeon]|nr:diphthine--ammonia ligase [Candidatus Woesearchaeota archaeon]